MVYAFPNTTYIFIINLGINEKGFTYIDCFQYNMDSDIINNISKTFNTINYDSNDNIFNTSLYIRRTIDY